MTTLINGVAVTSHSIVGEAMSFPPLFHIEARRGAPDVVTVALVGELDLATARFLMPSLSGLIDDRTDIVLDLSALSFVDAAGLSALLRTLRSLRSDGRNLTVDRQVSGQVRLLLEVVDAGPLIWPDRAAEATRPG